MARFMIACASASVSFVVFPQTCFKNRATRPSSGLEARAPILRELIERVRPVGAVDEVEIGVARVHGDRAPVAAVLHAVNHGAVAAGRLAEATAVVTVGQRAELGVDERNELARQVVGIVTERTRVHVLIAAERREAIGKHYDERPHLLLVHEPRGALGHVLVEGPPVRVAAAAAQEPDEVEDDGKARSEATAAPLVVLRGQPDVERPDVRVAERIAFEHLRRVREPHDAAGGPFRPSQRHGA
jgi:hypothetical protein